MFIDDIGIYLNSTLLSNIFIAAKNPASILYLTSFVLNLTLCINDGYYVHDPAANIGEWISL
jgi:hypothetical protein